MQHEEVEKYVGKIVKVVDDWGLEKTGKITQRYGKDFLFLPKGFFIPTVLNPRTICRIKVQPTVHVEMLEG